jgi:hypothetical protein
MKIRDPIQQFQTKNSNQGKILQEAWMEKKESLDKLIYILQEYKNQMRCSMNSFLAKIQPLERYINERKILFKLLYRENQV